MSENLHSPLPVRIWHWINALGFVAMIVTGGSDTLHRIDRSAVFPTAVVLQTGPRFCSSQFLVWLLFYLFSDKIKVYHPIEPGQAFSRKFPPAQYYGYGIFKGEPNPYHISVYKKVQLDAEHDLPGHHAAVVPLQFYTGVLLWDVKRFSAMITCSGACRAVDTAHC